MGVAILTAEIAGRLRMLEQAAKRGVVVRAADFADLPPLEIDGVPILTFEQAAAFARARLPLTSSTLSSMVTRATERGLAVSLQFRDDMHALLDARIETFLAEGGTVADWTRRVGDELTAIGLDPAHPYRLETILRTNVGTAYSAGRLAMLEDPDIAEAFPYLIYRTVGDSAVRPDHAAMEGRAYPTGHPIWDEWTPPCGYSCFLPGTVVGGAFVAGLRAWYAGPTIEIETRGGHRLRVTANHPILTTAGWRPAQALCQGDEVLVERGNVETRASGGEHDHQAPTVVEDVFEALAAQGTRTRAHPLPLDLHGDAGSVEGEIDVVRADGLLRHDADPAGAQGCDQVALATADARHPPLAHALHRLGEGEPCSPGLLPAAVGAPGGEALTSDDGWVVRAALQAGPLEPLRFGRAANLHARADEHAKQGGTGDPGLVRELLQAVPGDVAPDEIRPVAELRCEASEGRVALGQDAHALRSQGTLDSLSAVPERPHEGGDVGRGFVARDEIVRVERTEWRGHVYDLQTTIGWLMAGGIVSGNCRCGIIPASREDLAAEGITPSRKAPRIEGEPARPDEGFRFNGARAFLKGGLAGLSPAARREAEAVLGRA